MNRTEHIRATRVAFKHFINGNIITMQDGGRRVSDSMLICGDRIVAVGVGESAPIGFDCELIDLRGGTVIPGMVDSHAHFVWWSFGLSEVELFDAKSEAEAVAMALEHARRLAPGEWLVGRGWIHNFWDGGKLPNRESLDAHFPDRPVMLRSKCGHLIWVNSVALRAAGIDETTTDPPGGEIERSGNGKKSPTGILKEMATSLVESRIPKPTDEGMFAALRHGQKMAHACGITGVQAPEGMDSWEFLQKARAAGELTMRVDFWAPVESLDALIAVKTRAGLGDDLLRMTAIKCFTDGSLGGRTAFMYEDHENEPGNRGICCMDKDQLTANAIKANAAGLPVAVHAIGDRAVGLTLRAFDAANDEMKKRGLPLQPNRIEHLQLIAQRDLALLQKVRPVASMQPIHLCADMEPADRYWGERARLAYAFRTIADAGCILSFGSDAPVEPINPFFGIYAAATRRNLAGSPREGWNPQEKISREEALAGYTCNPAEAAGRGDRLGRIAPGMLADFVILHEDPLNCEDEVLRDMKPLATYSGGRCVYASGDWHKPE